MPAQFSARGSLGKCRRAAALVVLAAAVAAGLAACGGAKAPSVATIATTNNTTTATGASAGNRNATSATGKGSASGFLVEWTTCMRIHGDPDQADPTIDNHYGINITIPPGAPETLSNEVHGGTAPCNQYLAAATNALKAEHPAPPPPSNTATGVKYAACMRANGVHNYPDPTTTGNEQKTNLNGIDMNSPFFIRANKLCGKQIGAPAWWINGWGPPGNISVTNIPPGGIPNGPNRPRSSSGTTTTPNTAPTVEINLRILKFESLQRKGAVFQVMSVLSVQWSVFAGALAVCSLLAVSCGGSNAPSAAHGGTTTSSRTPSTDSTVADAGRASTTTPPSGATKLVDEWAACERSHGDSNQADPTIDAHGVINITTPGPMPGRARAGGMPARGLVVVGDPHGATGTCSRHLAAAQRELRAAHPAPRGPDQATYLEYVACMRANGVPNYPSPEPNDPTATNFSGSGVNPNSPSVVRVNDLCGKKLGLPTWWIKGWGPPGDISVSTPGPHKRSPVPVPSV